MLSLRPTDWLNDGVINEFERLLNLRQRRLEDESFSVPDVLYMGCFFYTKLTTDTRAGSLDRLRQVAGCDRCFLQQDLVVLPIHVGGACPGSLLLYHSQLCVKEAAHLKNIRHRKTFIF